MRMHLRLALALPALLLSLICGGCRDDRPDAVPPPGPRPPRAMSTIERENAAPGDAGWALGNPAYAHEVEGYGSRITLAAGEGLDVKVNVDRSRGVRWVLHRIGWYGGQGGRKLAEGGPLPVAPQPVCPRDLVTSRVECDWATAFHVDVPADAVAGVHLIKLITDDTSQEAYVPFVVYDGRTADIVMDINVTSWQAYNNFGGESLYEDASGTMPHGKAWEVSFDRPFAEGRGAGRFLAWEMHMVRWLEALAYDVTYTTAFDLGHDPTHPQAARLFLSVANDEYWTVAQRDAVETARDRGVNLAFLGADQALWRIRLQPSSRGAPERVVACYKADQDKDPVRAAQGDAAATTRFRDDPGPRPENGLVGVMYNAWLLQPQPLVVTNPSHWVFEGTGLAAGDILPRMVAFETDIRWDNGAEPAGLETLAVSPFVDAEGGPKQAMMTWYRAPSGAEVVGAGTMGWPSGLGDRIYANPLVARITRNIIERMVGDGRRAGEDPANAPWRAPSPFIVPQVVGAWASAVETVAGRDPSPFVAPAGLAVAADGTIFVADAPAHVIKRIAPDAARTVTVYAGDGFDGMVDGPGAQARFRWPTGLALAADGTLYVADADNQVIRAIAPDAARTVSTYAGRPARGGAFADGPADQSSFSRPISLALSAGGVLYVADQQNNRIRRVDPGGARMVSTLAGVSIGFGDGPGSLASFNNPSAVAVAPDGTVYVLDTYNQALRRIGAQAPHTVTTIVGGEGIPGWVDGRGSEARIGAQSGMLWHAGAVYLTDVVSDVIRVVHPGTDAASTLVSTFAGDGRARLADGPGQAASFATPLALAAGPDGSLYAADSGNRAVRRLRP